MHCTSPTTKTAWWWRKPMRAGSFWATSCVAALLAGCATPPGPQQVASSPGLPAPAVTKVPTPDPAPQDGTIAEAGLNLPYTVQRQTFAPIVADVPWTQRGLTSWYGKAFNGRRTVSGERFSAMGLTAAHRTLPIPSYIRVRHVASGREVIVRVNDRGPFHPKRILDLSYAAAMRLGIVSVGSAEVEIERLTIDDIRQGAWCRGEPPAEVP